MMKIVDETNELNQVDNKIELLKFLAMVATRIKKDITSDFTLAKLDDQNKTGIIDMTSNAYLLRRIINTLKEQSYTWTYNHETKTWTKNNLDENTKTRIEKIGQNIFDSYMVKVYMTAIMNRNVEQNHILNILGGIQQEEAELELEQEKENKVTKLLKKITGTNKKNEE